MSEIKQVSYDFSMDSLVSVDAPIGTNPESLFSQALNKLAQKMKANDVELTFDTIFDSESGDYDEDWENYANKKENEVAQ